MNDLNPERPGVMLFSETSTPLTTREVAEREGCDPQAISRWCRDGNIYPAKLIGGRWVIAENYTILNLDQLKADRQRGRPVGAKDSQPRYRRWRHKPKENEGA